MVVKARRRLVWLVLESKTARFIPAEQEDEEEEQAEGQEEEEEYSRGIHHAKQQFSRATPMP